MFIDVYYPKSDSDQQMRECGYYLKIGARSTDAFAENYPEVVSKALSMNAGEYAEVECKIGTCFIYKYKEENDVMDIDEDNPFFSDFYSDASEYAFSKKLEKHVDEVVFTEEFDLIKIVEIPQNYELYISTY